MSDETKQSNASTGTAISHEFPGLASASATGLARTPADAYDPDVDEVAAIRDHVGVVDLGWRDLLAVTGSDAIEFLQRMLSHNVEPVPVGGVQPNALLVRKGQMVAEMVMVRDSESTVWLDIASGRGAAVREALEPYVVVDDVTFTPLDDRFTLAWIVGPRTGELLNAMNWPAPTDGTVTGAVFEGHALTLLDRPLGELPGAVVRMPVAGIGHVWSRLSELARELGGDPVGFNAFETVRIEQGVGRWGADWTDQQMQKEAGLDVTVSYSKGCFIGQEPASRLHFRGQPARRLMRVSITCAADAVPAPGAMLLATDEGTAAGKDVGTITSSTWSSARAAGVALAYIKRGYLEAGTRLTVADSQCPVTVEARVGRDTPK